MLSKFIVKIGKNCVACGVCANSCPAGIIDKVERRKND